MKERYQTSASLLEYALSKCVQLKIHPTILSIAIAVVISLFAGVISWQISKAYYAEALYHYDSAVYRAKAVQVYDQYKADGRWYTFIQTLRQKDALDVSLRVLLMPDALLYRYGHMVVLVPFMVLYKTLLIYYVQKSSGSWVLGLACASFLFTFSFVFDVYWGIADYWKDNLSTWLFGASVLSLILADKLNNWKFSILSGALLGFVVVQRAVNAVYAVFLFIPPLIWALYYQFRKNGLRGMFVRSLVFVAPSLVLGGTIVVLQWQSLYGYYFVGGHAYADPVTIAKYLLRGIVAGVGTADQPFGVIPYGTGNGPFALAFAYIVCLFTINSWEKQRLDIITAAWFVVGLPLLVIATRAYYHGFFIIWMPLLIILLATLMPRTMNTSNARIYGLILILVAILTAGAQYFRSSNQARDLLSQSAPYRVLMTNLAKMIVAEPSAHAYAMFFNEADAPLYNVVYFDLGERVGSPAVFITFHDSYYRTAFAGQTPEQIVANSMKSLEQTDGALAVGHCNLNEVYQPMSDPLASAVILGLNRYLLESPYWRTTHRLESPFGCLYVYRYSSQPLSSAEKWGDMVFYGKGSAGPIVNEIPLALGLAPHVRIYDYSGRYSPELINGVYYQWLPSGSPGLSVDVFSDQERTVVFRAQVVPGPSRADMKRTLVINNSEDSKRIEIVGETSVSVDITLKRGLNSIEMYVAEAVDIIYPDNLDTRELMLLLVSPHFSGDEHSHLIGRSMTYSDPYEITNLSPDQRGRPCAPGG